MAQSVEILGNKNKKRDKNMLSRSWSWLWVFTKRKPLGAVGLWITVAFIFVAVFADYIIPWDPFEFHRRNPVDPPFTEHHTGKMFWFGTDQIGRDVFSRTLIGSRVSMYVGLVTMLAAAGGGLILGVSSAYIGGKFDLIIQRFVDGIIAMPTLILAMALVTALGQSINNVILAIAIVQIPRITRVIRSAALSIKEVPYIEAARAIGASDWRVMLRHVAPNTMAPLLIVASSAVGSIIITESTLSFLGLGVDPETLTWGALVSGDSRLHFAAAPWMLLGPGIAVTLVVFGTNMFGDALRDVLDPKLRGR